jgi:hypothetical protein
VRKPEVRGGRGELTRGARKTEAQTHGRGNGQRHRQAGPTEQRACRHADARKGVDTWDPDGRGGRRERVGTRTAADRWGPPVRRCGRAEGGGSSGLVWAEFGFLLISNCFYFFL